MDNSSTYRNGFLIASMPMTQSYARCSAEPELHRRSATTDIAAEDWDLSFRAALELLERVAVESPTPAGKGLQLRAPPGTVFRECLEALDQLRRSASGEQKRAIASLGSTPATGFDR
jgi:hypothetical protein